jgi:hypothetical protein
MVNSLWFWGGGELPVATSESGWSYVVADDPLARGLAQLHGGKADAPALTTLALAAEENRVLWQATVE